MIGEGEELAKISEWNDSVESEITGADGAVSQLQGWLDDKKREEQNVAREDQMKFEIKLHETKLKLQAEYQEAKPESPQPKGESEVLKDFCVKEDLASGTLEKRRKQIRKLREAREAGKIGYLVLDRLVIKDRPTQA